MQGDTRPAWLEDRRRPEVNVWKIAIGVAAGVLVASAIGYFVRVAMINHALGEFAKSTSNIVRAMNQQSALEQERQQRAKAIARQQEAERRAIEISKQREHEAALEHARALQQAKDKAWSKYYLKPTTCETAEGQAFVECANHHIRAKRQFEDLWSAGRL